MSDHFYPAHTMPPAQLWVGDHEILISQVHECMQKFFCLHEGCQVCKICLRIRLQQHHAIMWLAPDKTYTLEQLDDIFAKTALALEHNEHFFFIIQNASALSSACANRLLKIIEEPPTGYHFIFLTERTDTIPLTIISRCIMHTFRGYDQASFNPLLSFFTTDYHNNSGFSAALDKAKVAEQETAHILDSLMRYWHEQYTTTNNEAVKKQSAHILLLLLKAYHALPMPGSAQLFWRSLYLSLPR